MSDDIIALIIPLVAIAIIVGWVPLLNFLFPQCGRSLERQSFQRDTLKALSSMGSMRD
jgi:hypothetical protein